MATTNSTVPSAVGLHLYQTSSGELWDTQPACFLTDYFMGTLSLSGSIYVAMEHFQTRHDRQLRIKYIWWYLLFFAAVTASSAVGGIMHHMLHLTLEQIGNHQHHQHKMPVPSSQEAHADIFGLVLRRSTIDSAVEWLWNLTLTTTIVVDFALFALAAHHYLDHRETLFRIIMACAIAVYLGLVVLANIWLETYWMLVALVPAIVLGFGTSSWHALCHPQLWIRRRARNELIMFGFIMASALTMALELAPSRQLFNHNALAHVLMSVAVVLAAVNFALEKQQSPSHGLHLHQQLHQKKTK